MLSESASHTTRWDREIPHSTERLSIKIDRKALAQRMIAPENAKPKILPLFSQIFTLTFSF